MEIQTTWDHLIWWDHNIDVKNTQVQAGPGCLQLFTMPLSQYSIKDWITGCYSDFGTTSTPEGGINSPLKLYPVYPFNKAFNTIRMGSEVREEIFLIRHYWNNIIALFLVTFLSRRDSTAWPNQAAWGPGPQHVSHWGGWHEGSYTLPPCSSFILPAAFTRAKGQNEHKKRQHE